MISRLCCLILKPDPHLIPSRVGVSRAKVMAVTSGANKVGVCGMGDNHRGAPFRGSTLGTLKRSHRDEGFL